MEGSSDMGIIMRVNWDTVIPMGESWAMDTPMVGV
jgi:hypothetical protein